MDELPSEILRKILLQLDPLDILRLADVCQRFRIAAAEFKFYDRNTQQMNIVGLDQATIENLLRQFELGSNLTSLRLYNVQFDVGIDARKVRLKAFWLEVCNHLPLLADVVWHNVTTVSPTKTTGYFPEFPRNLRRLQLSGGANFLRADEISKSLDSRCCLQSLVLLHTGISPSKEREIYLYSFGVLRDRGYAGLKELFIGPIHCTEEADSAIFVTVAGIVVSRLKSLESLYLDGLEVDFRSLLTIVSSAVALKHLIVFGHFAELSDEQNTECESLSLIRGFHRTYHARLSTFVGGPFASKVNIAASNGSHHSIVRCPGEVSCGGHFLASEAGKTLALSSWSAGMISDLNQFANN